MDRRNLKIKVKLILISFALLSGCSNLHTYKNGDVKNVVMYMDKNSDSSVKGRADIFMIDRKNCRMTYKGSTWFNQKLENIGLENNKSYVIDFQFLVSSWLRGDSSIAERRMLKIKPGFKYEAKMIYEEQLYDLKLYEINKKNNKKRKIHLEYDTSCDNN